MRTLMILVVLLCGAGLAAQGQEIDIEHDGSSVSDGGTVDIGTVDLFETTTVDFTIQNEGSSDLEITGAVTVSNTNACTATVQQPGMTGRSHAGRTEDVLQRDRHTVQRPLPAAASDLTIRRRRRCAGILCGDRDVGVQVAVDLIDA